MTKLQNSITIRGNIIKNRIVMAPMVTFSFHGDNGSFYGNQHIAHYTERAKGGAGLIYIQATSILGATTSTEKWSDDNTKALAQIAVNCHQYGATVIMQLSCGNSKMEINELSISELHTLQEEMKNAAFKASEMGFDGVEYHFAHGFTFCKSLYASSNHRLDQYGGNMVNRTRIVTEILPEIRNKTNEKFIIGIRMGEYLPESTDGIEVAKIFENAGIDLLNISFGMSPPLQPVPEGYLCSSMSYSACKIKKEVHIPVIAVGEIRSEEQAKFLIENDYVDFVAIGRGMLADPSFANHIMDGEPVNKCYGCERCLWFTDHLKCPALLSIKK